MEILLVAARTLHFAATISLSGLLAFEYLVVDPAIRAAYVDFGYGEDFRQKLDGIFWASLAIALVSGVLWLAGVSCEMTDQSLGRVLHSGTIGTVLTQTRFGQDWLLRLAFASLLVVFRFFPGVRSAVRPVAIAWVALTLGALLLASLAWAGHGAATPGPRGELHLAADILHLLAAGIWLGALLPLAMLFRHARRMGDVAWADIVRTATLRFSTLAIGCVAILLASGIVNTMFLVGTVSRLIGTTYGQLLFAKIALFAVMLSVAAVNRLRLTPRLDDVTAARVWPTVVQLRRNALIEAAVGLGVLAIVGALGILPPAMHASVRSVLPVQVDFEALTLGSKVLLSVPAAACGLSVANSVAVATAAIDSNGVSAHYPEAAGLVGEFVDANNKGRAGITQFYYELKPSIGFVDSVDAGLLFSPAYLDTNDIADDEYRQFMGTTFVNDPTIPLPVYTLGGAVEGSISKSFGYTLFASSTADLQGSTYSNLFDFSTEGHGAFVAGEMNWDASGLSGNAGVWVNTDKSFTNFSSGQSEDDNGVYGNVNGTLGSKALEWNVRLGWANPHVSQAEAFAGAELAYDSTLHLGTFVRPVTYGLGASYTAVSSDMTGPKADKEQVEMYSRVKVTKHVSVTADLQHLNHSQFDPTLTSAWIGGVRVGAEF